MIVAFDLREIEGQVVRKQPMLGAGFFKRDLGIGQRKLLNVMDVMD
jgi:hypothetical protein